MADATTNGILHGVRLLEDFLEHEMREFSALDFLGGKFHLANLRADRRRLDGGHLKIVACQRHDLEIVQIYDTSRVGDDGADIAGEEVFLASDPNEQGTTPTRSDDLLGVIYMNDGDAVRSHNILQRAADSFAKPCAVGAGILCVNLFIMFADQVSQYLGVRLRNKFVSLGEQAIFEELMIFDHAIVDEGDFAGLIEMGVRVAVRWSTVRRPARVTNAGIAFGWLLGENAGQVIDAAGLFAEFKLFAIDDAEPG